MGKRQAEPTASRANRALLKENLATHARRRPVVAARERAIEAIREFADKVRGYLRDLEKRLPSSTDSTRELRSKQSTWLAQDSRGNLEIPRRNAKTMWARSPKRS
jgi:hypothetical protein